MASSDPRVVGGAVLGSLAHDEGDEWSDLDLMFAVADDVPVTEVLEAWSRAVVREFDAVQLFDLPSGPIIYRVFLLPNCLELDLSLTPAPNSVRAGRSSSCCSGRPSNNLSVRRLPHTNSSDTPSTTHCMHDPASSGVGIGRRSIGSARYAITHSPLLVGAEGSMAHTAGTSTSCPPTSWIRSTMRSCDRSIQTNSIVRWEAPLPDCFANRRRPKRWLRRSKVNFTNSRRDASASPVNLTHYRHGSPGARRARSPRSRLEAPAPGTIMFVHA